MQKTLPFVFLALLFAAPAARADEGDPTVEELATMILEGNDAEHALVAKWLEGAERDTLRKVFAKLRELRRAAPKPVPVPGTATLLQAEFRIIDVSPEKAAQILGEARPTATVHWHLVSAEAAAELLRRVERGTEATLITAPRLTVYESQKANVSVTNQVSYVKDFDVQVAPSGEKIANPVVGTVQDGLVIDFRGFLQDGGRDVRMEFEGTWASLERPIAEETIDVDGRKLTKQVPQVSVTRAKAEALLPDGGWALIGSGVPFGRGDEAVERVALVHVKVVQVAPDFPGEDIVLVPSNFQPPKPPQGRKGPRVRKK